MENGLMTIEKTDDKMKAVFVDQDVIEFARLNMRTKNRIREQKKEHEKAVRSKKQIRKTVNRILAEAGFGGAVAFGGSLGMIHPLIWIPTAIISLCVACLHFGALIGKVTNNAK